MPFPGLQHLLGLLPGLGCHLLGPFIFVFEPSDPILHRQQFHLLILFCVFFLEHREAVLVDTPGFTGDSHQGIVNSRLAFGLCDLPGKFFYGCKFTEPAVAARCRYDHAGFARQADLVQLIVGRNGHREVGCP